MQEHQYQYRASLSSLRSPPGTGCSPSLRGGGVQQAVVNAVAHPSWEWQHPTL